MEFDTFLLLKAGAFILLAFLAGLFGFIEPESKERKDAARYSKGQSRQR